MQLWVFGGIERQSVEGALVDLVDKSGRHHDNLNNPWTYTQASENLWGEHKDVVKR